MDEEEIEFCIGGPFSEFNFERLFIYCGKFQLRAV
jgi:hypothetical protein